MLASVMLMAALLGTPMADPEPTIQQARNFVIPKKQLKAAADEAKARTGINVNLNTTANMGVVLLTQCYNKETALGGTQISKEQGHTVAVIVYPNNIIHTMPQTKDNADIMHEILVLIIAHELHHCAPQDGGPGVPDTPSSGGAEDCEHLKLYMEDGTRTCDDVTAASNDQTLTGEEKCDTIFALCRFHKWLQEVANTTANVNHASANCPNDPNDPNHVPTPNGKIVQDCPGCPTTECPVHNNTPYTAQQL